MATINILIIDDESCNLKLLERSLNTINKKRPELIFNVCYTQSTEMALAIIQDKGLPFFDLIIQDDLMPEPVGESMTYNIRKIEAEYSISPEEEAIIVTYSTSYGEHKEDYYPGANYRLEKGTIGSTDALALLVACVATNPQPLRDKKKAIEIADVAPDSRVRTITPSNTPSGEEYALTPISDQKLNRILRYGSMFCTSFPKVRPPVITFEDEENDMLTF